MLKTPYKTAEVGGFWEIPLESNFEVKTRRNLKVSVSTAPGMPTTHWFQNVQERHQERKTAQQAEREHTKQATDRTAQNRKKARKTAVRSNNDRQTEIYANQQPEEPTRHARRKTEIRCLLKTPHFCVGPRYPSHWHVASEGTPTTRAMMSIYTDGTPL
eukprot:gene17050-23344_t